MTDTAALLRNRADSYWRDARTLRGMGDKDAALIFETIADELRKIADQIAPVKITGAA
jgi:hypothetical protein